MFLGQFNQTLNDSSKQTIAQSQRFQLLETTPNSNTPPIDFNRLSYQLQFLVKNLVPKIIKRTLQDCNSILYLFINLNYSLLLINNNPNKINSFFYNNNLQTITINNFKLLYF
ncbi:unnamed protein product [Paramecium sonneborni]|uniref:Uncharacterized protein n=1 Tax=Paramecium sonneborni TaxID=65129 RepID=A0A8S1R8D5_9CILI|nr:unnamed protein product [Paramecium sonneborni]